MLPFPGEGSNLALTLPLAPAGHQHGRVHSCHGEYQVEECIVVWHRPLVAPANHVHPTRLRITPRRALKQQPCKNPSVKAAVRMASGFGAAGGVPKQDRASERPAARGPSHLPGRKPSEMCCEARVAVRSDLPPTVASRTLRPLSGINGSGHPPFASSLQMVSTCGGASHRVARGEPASLSSGSISSPDAAGLGLGLEPRTGWHAGSRRRCRRAPSHSHPPTPQGRPAQPAVRTAALPPPRRRTAHAPQHMSRYTPLQRPCPDTRCTEVSGATAYPTMCSVGSTWRPEPPSRCSSPQSTPPHLSRVCRVASLNARGEARVGKACSGGKRHLTCPHPCLRGVGRGSRGRNRGHGCGRVAGRSSPLCTPQPAIALYV
jgi:hypothetical protein